MNPLVWYPRDWRERYGDELAALIEDDGRPWTLRFHLSMAWGGLRERARGAGGPTDRARGGAIVVLVAWAAFVVAGSSFAKMSEGFRKALRPTGGRLPVDAAELVGVGAVVGGLAVLAGLVITVPAVVRFLRAGGWPSIRRPVRRAVLATVVAGVALAALSAGATALTPAERNGDLLYHPVVWYYLVAFLATTGLLVVALTLCTAAAVTMARRVDLPAPVIRAEVALAAVVTVAMTTTTAAAAVWWGTVASAAPWFLQGTPIGSSGSAFNVQAIGTTAVMLLATGVATLGTARAVRSVRRA